MRACTGGKEYVQQKRNNTDLRTRSAYLCVVVDGKMFIRGYCILRTVNRYIRSTPAKPSSFVRV